MASTQGKIDEQLIGEVTRLIKLGVPPLTAALANEVTEEEFCKWMEKGAQGGRGHWSFEKFFKAVEKAEAEAEAIIVGRIRSAASEQWAAAAWLAERRWPEKYVRRSVTTKEQQTADAADGDPFADVDKVVPLRKP